MIDEGPLSVRVSVSLSVLLMVGEGLLSVCLSLCLADGK